jgi:hypothetical protein
LEWDDRGDRHLAHGGRGIHDRLPDLSILALVPRVLWLLMYMAAAARLVQRFRAEWLIWEIRRQPALCVLLALAAVSSVWSLAPAITLQRSISLLGTTVLGMFIGHACPPQRLMRVLYWTFVVLMVISVAAALMFPAPVGDGVPVGWRGIMMHKNSFGAAAALATSCFVVLALGRLIRPLWGGALSALGTIAVAEAHSRTSLVVLGVCLVAAAILAFFWATRHPHGSLVRRASFGLVLGISVAPLVIRLLGSMFEKDDPR